MESMLIALRIVLPLFLMMAAGYIIRVTGIMNETSVKQTNKAIFKIFLPLLVFKNVYTSDLSVSFSPKLLIFAAVGVIIQFFAAMIIVIACEKDSARRGVMLQGMFRSNFVLFGIPVCTALFGDEAAGMASILIAVIIPMYNAFAVVALEIFKGGKTGAAKTVKGIITNPLIIASLVGLIFTLFKIKLPYVLETTVSSLGGIATPLAFVVLGASFAFKAVKDGLKQLCITLGVKLLIFPALFMTAAVFLGFSGPSLAILLTVFASPVAVSSFTMAQQMGGDESLAGNLVIFSSVLSILTLFVFIFVLKQFGFM